MLKESEAGPETGGLCRKGGISQQPIYRSRYRSGNSRFGEASELLHLRLRKLAEQRRP